MGKLLDQKQNTTHIGEIRLFAQIGFLENRSCECGNKLGSCPFWGPIIDEMSSRFDLEYIAKLSKKLPRNRDIYAARVTKNKLKISEKYIEFLSVLYQIIFDRSDSGVIIDSTKFPVHLEALSRKNLFDIRVIHLTRDPRGVVDSWSRRNQTNRGESSKFIIKRPALNVALSWRLCNSLVSSYKAKFPYFDHVKWENVTRDPAKELERLNSAIGLGNMNRGFDESNKTEIEPGHAFWGNSSRKLSGQVRIIHRNDISGITNTIFNKFIYYISGAYNFGY